MAVHQVSGDELVGLLASSATSPDATDVVVVDDPPSGDRAHWAAASERLRTVPCIVVAATGWAAADPAALALVDLMAVGDGLDAVLDTAALFPQAATALAVHLRSTPFADVDAGLVAESALYSLLQGGAEFAAWRAATPRRSRPVPEGPAVVLRRDGDDLQIELARPEVRNAFGARMRDDLLEALAVAEADPDLHVTISGQGPAFCSGGHLDEFGTAPDPVTAHAIRLARSAGAALARLAGRTTVHLHGPCYGAGIELPAFAGHVVARDDTTVALPEVGLGLIPGAGGTVSIPRRIGRHHTAWLALTRRPVDARTALRWGLVDEVTPTSRDVR